jgi:hypothetical protein
MNAIVTLEQLLMNAADAWINNNLDAIGILGKTEIVRIAFEAGRAEGQMDQLTKSQQMLDRLEQTVMGKQQA